MLYRAKNGRINGMDYVRFGRGERVLILIPGLGDGLQTVKGKAIPMALTYRSLVKEFTVYMLSRKDPLPPGQSTRDMAGDVKGAMDALGIGKADIVGVSMGGMIAQWLAIDFPEKTGKLILTVTCACPNPILEASVCEWVACARAGDHTAFMGSNLRRIYSEDYCRRNKWLVPILGKLTKPKSYDRFFLQADACLTHNAYECLHRIKAQTLVIGGEKDLALGGEASVTLAAGIVGAGLHMYPQWGHGLYEEAKDFNRVVLDFLKE